MRTAGLLLTVVLLLVLGIFISRFWGMSRRPGGFRCLIRALVGIAAAAPMIPVLPSLMGAGLRYRVLLLGLLFLLGFVCHRYHLSYGAGTRNILPL